MSTQTQHDKAAATWPENLEAFWRSLREFGYTSICRIPDIYLFHMGSGRHCLTTPVDNGRWIGQGPFAWSPYRAPYGPDSHFNDNWRDLILPPWRDCSAELTPAHVMEFRQVARDCYCYQGVQRCDFCTGLRRPDRYRDDYASLEEAQEMLRAGGWTMKASHRWTKGEKWASIGGAGSTAGMPTIYTIHTGEA